MACYNDDPQKRPGGYWDDWHCSLQATGCKKGYERASYETSKGGNGISCFGDSPAIPLYDRYHALCVPDASQYPGDPDIAPDPLASCCTGRTYERACKPGYCKNAPKCQGLFTKWCATSFDLGDKQVCKDWCIGNQGKCDTAAQKYCKANPEDTEFCACLNSPVTRGAGGSAALPTCFDGNCIARGYQTATMLENAKHCPQICQQAVVCIQQSHGKCKIDKNQFELHCGGTPYPTPPAGKCDAKNPCPQGAMCITGTCIPAILIIILLILAAVILALVAFSHKLQSGPPELKPAA